MTFEVIAAAALLRKIAPCLRVRVVNVTDLMVLGAPGTHPHALSDEAFNNLFTKDRRIHFNYHGYAVEIQVKNTLDSGTTYADNEYRGCSSAGKVQAIVSRSEPIEKKGLLQPHSAYVSLIWSLSLSMWRVDVEKPLTHSLERC